MTTELEQKIAEQAAVIEKLSKHSNLLVEAYNFGQFADDFNQPQARNVREALRETCEALAIQTNSKQILAEWLDKVLGEPELHAYKNTGQYAVINADASDSRVIALFKKPEIK